MTCGFGVGANSDGGGRALFEKIKSNVTAAIISAAIIGAALGIWEVVADGSLIGLLGGATTGE